MKILVVGGGGREHAIVRALAREKGSPHEIHAAGGNPGMAASGATLHPDLDPCDPGAVVALAREAAADLVVIGPEAPLVAGVADALQDAKIPVFGPTAAAARLEGSKAFAKEVMAAAGVPTAAARVATTPEQVAAALDEFGAPFVVKDDGLAAGKGVLVTTDREAALAHGAACLAGGGQVVVEDFLDGPEVSLFVICDGQDAVPLQAAQDFKRALDHDEGPNTGGMGAYSPLDWAPADLSAQVVSQVARPVLAEMARRGTPYVGVLYVGLAMTSRGPRVVEFNARFGDPETQVVLPLLATPLSTVLLAAATGTLASLPPLEWHPRYAVNVVLAAEHYPQTPRLGDPLRGVARAATTPGVHVLLAGARVEGEALLSAGGRVLSVVGEGDTLAEARRRAYQAIALVDLPGSHYRSDIAGKAERGEIAC
ncbi:MAG: phosphoribosylamine--glycine ligase [Promicromonosporaceae bacterium]|nr:phosphoribosylamine--glycine ligase [Promicromonosporaceae bacterium]